MYQEAFRLGSMRMSVWMDVKRIEVATACFGSVQGGPVVGRAFPFVRCPVSVVDTDSFCDQERDTS